MIAPMERVARAHGVSRETAEVAERLLSSVVVVRSRNGGGSGVIWEADGLIVTNNHVVREDTATVVIGDARKLQARVVMRSPEADLAALRVEAVGLTAATVGDSSRVRVGQVVLAAGNPLGLQGVVTAGIITGAGQVSDGERTRLDDLIQADVSLAPGNSGGPLADVDGKVLGINSMISSAGVALAIPSQVVLDWITPEVYSRAYVGLRLVTVPTASTHQRRALLVLEVEEGSPADRAGLMQGDLLTGLGDHSDGTPEELQRVLGALQRGSAVTVHALRGGEHREFAVVPVLHSVA